MSQSPNANSTERSVLRLGIVGGGRACKGFLRFIQSKPFSFLDLEVVAVCDVNPEAVGFRLAREMGITTTVDVREVFAIPDLHCIVELTNSRDVLQELIRSKPEGVGIMDHNTVKLTWGLYSLEQRLKSAEDQVQLERGAYHFLLQQAKDRIVTLRPDFSIVEVNEPYLQAVGRTREEVIGAHCYEITHGLSLPCSSALPGSGCPLLETLQTGEPAHVIHECPSRGPGETYCDMLTYPVKDRQGRIVRVIEIWRDITEALTNQLEKRTKILRDDLQKMVQEDRLISLGKLVASSVHEINNPIQGLLTFSHLMQSMLADGEVGPEQLEEFKKYLGMMTSELERCGGIVSSLLSFARQSSTEYRCLDLKETLGSVLALTRHRMDIQNIRLKTALPDVPLLVLGDVNQLQQCFLNLVFNAIEAMPGGGELVLEARGNREQENVEVCLRDTGQGIAEEHLNHIFDPFFTTKGEGEGTGLGLSIVYGVVKTHGGSIEVASEPGKGTAFTLVFPVSRERSARAEE